MPRWKAHLQQSRFMTFVSPLKPNSQTPPENRGFSPWKCLENLRNLGKRTQFFWGGAEKMSGFNREGYLFGQRFCQFFGDRWSLKPGFWRAKKFTRNAGCCWKDSSSFSWSHGEGTTGAHPLAKRCGANRMGCWVADVFGMKHLAKNLAEFLWILAPFWVLYGFIWFSDQDFYECSTSMTPPSSIHR